MKFLLNNIGKLLLAFYLALVIFPFSYYLGFGPFTTIPNIISSLVGIGTVLFLYYVLLIAGISYVKACFNTHVPSDINFCSAGLENFMWLGIFFLLYTVVFLVLYNTKGFFIKRKSKKARTLPK